MPLGCCRFEVACRREDVGLDPGTIQPASGWVYLSLWFSLEAFNHGVELPLIVLRFSAFNCRSRILAYPVCSPVGAIVEPLRVIHMILRSFSMQTLLFWVAARRVCFCRHLQSAGRQNPGRNRFRMAPEFIRHGSFSMLFGRFSRYISVRN